VPETGPPTIEDLRAALLEILALKNPGLRVRWLLSMFNADDPFQAALPHEVFPGSLLPDVQTPSHLRPLFKRASSAKSSDLQAKFRGEILRVLERAADEAEEAAREQGRKSGVRETEERVNEKERELHKLETSLSQTRRLVSRPRHALNWMYVLLLGLVFGIVAVLIAEGWAQPAEVSIEFNVGEIIGGLLVGAGAAAAGGAYAFKVLTESERERG